MARAPFVVFDVFTDRPFSGNPLAIVPDAAGLSDAQMQAIATEFNLAETIFLSPPENPAHSARARIFTPAYEMQFAGHPTVGAAIYLAQQRFGSDSEHGAIIVLEENVGPVRCAVTLRPGQAGFAEFDAPRLSAPAGPAASDAELAQALSIAPEDIGFDRHFPTTYSAGAKFVYVPVKSLDVLSRVGQGTGFRAAAGDAIGVVAYARLPEESPHAFRVRMFAPDAGVPEDPATGSAAAAFAGVIARFEGLADGRHQMPIEQGVEMGRPSLIALEIETAEGALSACRVGGFAVHVSSGEILLP